MQQSGQPNAFTAHTRAVGALISREMATRFGNKPGGYIWAILEPVAQIVILSFIFSALLRSPALGTSFVLFYATGFTAFQYYLTVSTWVAKSVSSNKSLLAYPTVAPIDTVVARAILQIVTTSVVTVIIFIFTREFFVRYWQPIAWIHVVEAVSAACILGVGVAMANVALVMRFPIYGELFAILSRPLFLVSGVFYLPDNLPHPAKDWVLYNPLAHMIMRFREGFYPEYRGLGFDQEYLWAVTICIFTLGLFIFTVLRGTFRSFDS